MLTIAVKHALSIRGKDASMTLLGDVVSYSDCPQLIASSLCIHSFVLFEEFKDKVRGSFILGVYKTSSHADSEVVKALASLRTQSHKAALVYLNREGTIGLLRPLDEERRRGCILERFAFECFIVESSSKKNNEIASSSSSSFVTKKRKSESITPSLQSNPQPDLQSDQQKAADHYNSLVRDRDTRSASQIFHLRNLNGFVKSLLISTSSSKIQVLLSIPKNNLRVLDVCCGHGGDVNKWLNNNPVGVSSYVGIDIAQSGLQDFITSRLVNHKKKNAVQKLIAADIGRDSLVSSKLPCFTWKTNEWSHQIPLTLQETFHIASCQFAVHYMFESYARALHFFEEISRHLVKGGKLIITTVDCRVLRELVYQQLSSELCLPLKEKEKEVDDEEEDVVIVIRNDLGNKIVEITMEHEIVQRLLKSNEQDEEDTSNNDMFGLRYTFCLFDDPLTSTAAVNAPEWLVPLGAPLEALAAKANLKLTEMTNFHDYVTEAIKKENINSASNRTTMENMNVFSYDGVVPPGDWKVSRLYTVLVFEKEEELSSNIPFSQPEPMPPTYSYNHYRFFIPSSPDYAFDAQDSVGDATAIENRGVEDFQPQSPDFPPESNFMPTTPDYAPEEEGHKVEALVPTSPDYNPYENNDDQDHYIVPTSPDYNPEEEASASSSVTQNWGQKDDAMLSKEKEDPPDEESEMLLRLLQVRNRAVELAGGQHRWDLLTEEEADIFMEQATALHSSAHGGAVIVPSSPDFPPPSESDPFCPTSPDFPPPEDDTVIPKSPDSSPPPETSNSTGRFAWNSVSSWD